METTNTQTFSAMDPQPPVAPQRPQFLTVLCILTWIACGLLLVSTLWGVMFQDSPEEQYENIERMREVNPEMADKMEQAIEVQQESNQTLGILINLVAIGLSAFGVHDVATEKNGILCLRCRRSIALSRFSDRGIGCHAFDAGSGNVSDHDRPSRRDRPCFCDPLCDEPETHALIFAAN